MGDGRTTDENDLEDDQEDESEVHSRQLTLVEQRTSEFDVLASKLVENGFKLRQKVFAIRSCATTQSHLHDNTYKDTNRNPAIRSFGRC
jgi:hypothetical protein